MSSPDKPVLKVAPCSHDAAKYAVENWHYSKRMPVNKLVKFGAWENELFIGCVVYSCGSAGVGSMASKYGIDGVNVAELARVALSSHVSPVSKIVSVSLRLLKKAQPGLRLIVSYADPEQGHEGIIYRAGNWFFVGYSSKDVAYIDRNGKRWHSRSVSESGYKMRMGVKTKCPRPSEMKEIQLLPKLKYLMPLDAEMRERILPLAKPYPKRAGSSLVEHSDSIGEAGGSIPTPALKETANEQP